MTPARPYARAAPSGAGPSEVLCGVHAVREALRARRRSFFTLYRSATREDPPPIGLLETAEALSLPVQTIPPAQLTTLAGTPSHQGWALRASPYPLVTDLARLWRQNGQQTAAEVGRHAFWLILDQVVDPHNLGALLRTALCAGVDGVILSRNRTASPSPTVSRISAGAMEHLQILQVTNLVRSMQWLQQQGLWLTGLAREASQSIYTADFRSAAGLLVGGEAKGLRRLVRRHCDLLAAIPQEADFNSLNASVAGAVAMYEVFRQRNTAGAANPGTTLMR